MLAMKFGIAGLAKLGWLNRLKKSAPISKFTRSVIGVFFAIEKFNSLKLGPISEFRLNVPKCRVPATQFVSSVAPGSRFGFHVHGAAKADRSIYCKGLLE